MSKMTPNPDNRLYLATGSNAWAVGKDPVAAVIKAANIAARAVGVFQVFHVVHDTWDVSYMGEVMCNDIRKGVPLPIGLYEVQYPLSDDEDGWANDVNWDAKPTVTPVESPEAEEWRTAVWEGWEQTRQRARTLDAAH